MELRQIKVFVMAAEELNISRLARRLNMTQPALSRQLKALEESLGVALFVRSKAGLSLTPAGQQLLGEARELVCRASRLTETASRLASGEVRALRVGYIPPLLHDPIISGLRKFNSQHPEVAVDLREMVPGDQILGLREGRLDLAFIGHACKELAREFTIVVVKRIHLAVILPDHHLLSLRKTVALEELAREDFIGFEEASFPQRNEVIRAACRDAGFEPRWVAYVENLNALRATVASGRGISLAPIDLAGVQSPHNIFVPLRRRKGRRIPVVEACGVHAFHPRHPQTRAFLETCVGASGILSQDA